MTKTHVLPDENLGGVLREYVEVDRPAKEGDLIIFRDAGYDITAGNPYRVVDSRSYTDAVVFIDDADERHVCENPSERFFVIEPTDIIHIDGARYRLVDRKAKVGEKVLIVNARPLLPYSHVGEVVEIIGTDGDTYGGMLKPYDIGEKGAVYRFQYRVLEPVEPVEEGDDVLTVDETEASKSVIDLLANLAQRVTELERAYETLKRRQVIDNIHVLKRRQERLFEEINAIYRKIDGIEADVQMALSDIVMLDERTQPLVALVKAVKADE
jgi:hypothetical protein